MYKDFNKIGLGTTPRGEDCAQIGQDNYYVNCKIETRAFIAQLKRVFGEPPPSAFFDVTSCSHDFGVHYNVKLYYDTKNQRALDYAKRCKDETPQNWDAEARKELKEKGYSLLK
jgi:hypothetical protein